MSDGHPEVGALIDELLDGTISVAGAARLSAALERDPAFAREVAARALLHDALDREHHDAVAGRAHAWRVRMASLARRAGAVAAAAAVASMIVWAAVRTVPPASASDVVARLVSAAHEGDRTYVLRADSDSRPFGKRREGREGAASWKLGADGRRPQPPIDGAVLTVRDPNRYVLVRTDADGRVVVTGCDGRAAWSVPASGPVRTSDDVRRFSGAVPGSRLDLPFINPHESLADLGSSYELAMLPASPREGQRWPRIVAARRPDAKGGPRTIEIAYDPESGVIHAMRLGQLPQARGGPRAVVFELVDQPSLQESFYSHDAHHEAGRPVLKE